MTTRENVPLSYESNLPSLAGATEWLNSEPLTAADLRGHVVVDFWRFTCINWIRTAPYRRAWDEKYREHGLTVIGVHTPEFPFERDVDGIRHWPALYVADAEGAIAFHHFGEGRYGKSERVTQALLDQTGGLAEVEGAGVEAAADWTAEGTEPVRFRVRLDGDPPGKAGGIDVDERTFEITFLERGAEAYVFTFG